MKLFPIMDSKVFHRIPWDLLAPHEKQAQLNHYQSLHALATRGGLHPLEAVAVIEDIDYRKRWPDHCTAQHIEEAEERLLRLVAEHIQKS